MHLECMLQLICQLTEDNYSQITATLPILLNYSIFSKISKLTLSAYREIMISECPPRAVIYKSVSIDRLYCKL